MFALVARRQVMPQLTIPYSQISRWIKTADVARLEHAVYMGKGAHMRGREATQ